jgi:hypothetical protein
MKPVRFAVFAALVGSALCSDPHTIHPLQQASAPNTGGWETSHTWIA